MWANRSWAGHLVLCGDWVIFKRRISAHMFTGVSLSPLPTVIETGDSGVVSSVSKRLHHIVACKSKASIIESWKFLNQQSMGASVVKMFSVRKRLSGSSLPKATRLLVATSNPTSFTKEWTLAAEMESEQGYTFSIYTTGNHPIPFVLGKPLNFRELAQARLDGFKTIYNHHETHTFTREKTPWKDLPVGVLAQQKQE